MRILNFINGIEGVGSGNTATANIPVNRRYHALKVFPAGTDGTGATTDPVRLIARVRLYVNGVVIRDLTPTMILKIAALNGITVATGELPIYFSEPWRASVLGEELPSWDLAGQIKTTLEITYLGSLTGLSTAIIAAFDYSRNFEVKNGVNVALLNIIKQKVRNYNANSGVYDVTTLPIENPIQRILLQTSTGTISQVETYRDNEKVQEGLTAENSAFLKDYKMDASQFSFPLVFDFEQQLSSALLVAKDLLLKVTSSAANTLSVIVEERAPDYR